MVPLEQEDPLEQEHHLAVEAHQVPVGHQVHQELGDHLAQVDLQDQEDHLAQVDLQVQVDHQDQVDLQVWQVLQEQVDHQDQLDPQARVVLQDQEDPQALADYQELQELVAPIAIRENDSAPSAKDCGYRLTLQKMKVSTTEIRGRARVIPDGDNTETLDADHIYMAIGAGPEAMWNLPHTKGSGVITLSHCALSAQGVPVIVGGDLTNDTKSVTDAIASGKQAAMALDIYFKKGLDAIAESLDSCRVANGTALSMSVYLGSERKDRNSHVVAFAEINSDYFQSSPRAAPTGLSAQQRIQSFAEIEADLSKDTAASEAQRCFNCGICTACDYCRIYCPEVAVMVEKTRRHINLDYCKGCGICVTECPRNAMALEEEKK